MDKMSEKELIEALKKTAYEIMVNDLKGEKKIIYTEKNE